MMALPLMVRRLLVVALLFAGAGCDPASSARPATGSATAAESSSKAVPLATASATVTADAAAAAQQSKRLNVIVILVDCLRADRVPWAGYAHEVVPNIAEFAKRAVTYTRFYSLSSYTAMTVGGMFAGRYPSEVQRSGYFFSAYPQQELMFPELLQQAQIRTLAVQGHSYFRKEKAGLHQGFDVWEIVPGLKKSNTTDQNITSPKYLEMALAQLGEPANTKQPFFAWYHFLDPHDMYMGHQGLPKFGRGARGLYDGELYFTDQHVGKLLDFIAAQRWADHTAVIVSADHGETFGEHEMYRHGFELWEELIHVPLLVHLPGIEPRTIDVPRSGIDLAPTILELLEVEPDPSYQGVSLAAELRGAEPKPRAVIADLPRTSDNDRRRALIWGKHKLIAHGDDEYFKLFDLEADPQEQRDLARKEPELLKQMRQRYQDASKTIKDVCPKMRNKLKGKKKNQPC